MEASGLEAAMRPQAYVKAPKPAKKMIEGMHIFAGLSGKAIAALTARTLESKAGKGEIVVREGTPGREMFLIGRGRVEVVKAAGSPQEVALARLGAGDFFGEMSIIECRPRSASIRALEPTVLYSLKCDDLLRLFHEWPDQYGILIFNIARHLCRRLRAMDEVFASTAF